MALAVDRIDHVVLNCRDVERHRRPGTCGCSA